MYKDKDRQRVASAEAMRRYRKKHKGITGELVKSNVIPSGVIPSVIPDGTMTPEGPKPEVPTNYGQSNCGCRHCQQTKTKRERGQIVLNHGAYKTADELGENEVNRMSLPGDVDYAGDTATPDLDIREGFDEAKMQSFAGLPPDVQQAIEEISDSPEEKTRRTANAIHYQHIFPDGAIAHTVADSAPEPAQDGGWTKGRNEAKGA